MAPHYLRTGWTKNTEILLMGSVNLRQTKILSQWSKRKEIFPLMAGLEVTFLGADLNYQPLWWLGVISSIACCRNCLAPFSSMSCHYQCCYIVPTTGDVVLILAKSQTTQIKIKDWIFLGNSLHILNTPQLFSMVSSPIVYQYMDMPNSHKFKLSTDEIPSQQSKRKEIFHLASGLEVIFLGA